MDQKDQIYNRNGRKTHVNCLDVFNFFLKILLMILFWLELMNCFLSTVDFVFMLMPNCFISNERQIFLFTYFYPKSYIMFIIIIITILTNQLRAFPGEQDELTLCWPAWQSAFIISILTYYRHPSASTVLHSTNLHSTNLSACIKKFP